MVEDLVEAIRVLTDGQRETAKLMASVCDRLEALETRIADLEQQAQKERPGRQQ